MKNEEWRDVVGYEGYYQVSSEGRVKSLKRTFIDKSGRKRTVKERILKPAFDGWGYLIVTLCACGKRKNLMVHRLVCEAFNDNRDEKPEVNHINEIKTDNRACNLEWCTRRENLTHGTRSERSAKTLSKPICQYTLDEKIVKTWASLTEVKRQTGFGQSHISQVANGKRKQAYGFIWKYI